MTIGTIDVTNWRGPAKARSLAWIALSLSLHLLLMLRSWFAPAPVVERTLAAVSRLPPASEIPVELGPEPSVSNELPPRSERTTQPLAPSQTVPVAEKLAGRAGRVAPATSASGSAQHAAPVPSSSVSSEGSSFTDLEPSRSGDRLMFDPFRALRGRSSGGIRALIDTPRLHDDSLGALVTALVTRMDASHVLGRTGIDPRRETRRIFIQARALDDADGVVILVQHRLEREALRARLAEAEETLRAGGERFLLMPTPSIVLIAPQSIASAAEGLAALVALPSSTPPAVAWVHVETPGRALAGTPLSVPQGLRWLEVRIAPDAEGGLMAQLQGEVEDEQSSTLAARELAAGLATALRDTDDLPALAFRATGAMVVVTCHLSAAEVAQLTERVASD